MPFTRPGSRFSVRVQVRSLTAKPPIEAADRTACRAQTSGSMPAAAISSSRQPLHGLTLAIGPVGTGEYHDNLTFSVTTLASGGTDAEAATSFAHVLVEDESTPTGASPRFRAYSYNFQSSTFSAFSRSRSAGVSDSVLG